MCLQDMENTTGAWDMYGVDDPKRYNPYQNKFFQQSADILSRREAINAFGALCEWADQTRDLGRVAMDFGQPACGVKKGGPLLRSGGIYNSWGTCMQRSHHYVLHPPNHTCTCSHMSMANWWSGDKLACIHHTHTFPLWLIFVTLQPILQSLALPC